MLSFATIAFLAGATLGTVARLPVLIAVVCGFILAIITASIAAKVVLGAKTSLFLALIVGVVFTQMGYGAVIVVRALLAHRRAAASRASGTSREEPRPTRGEASLRIEKRSLDRLSQD